jgi:beta-N-acetylhexosaminidase
VNTNAANPVVGVRSFGSDPVLVARHVAASVTGLQAGGIAACVKHFPGHGATDVDSHLGLPVLDASRDELQAVELEPFRAAFRAGTRSLMTAHMVVTALDARPATLSRAILTDLLRDELGFDGMVVTDALEMGAISGAYGMGEAAVLALEAGADALCLGHDIDASHVDEVRTALVEAVHSGRVDEKRLAEAASRVASSHAPPTADSAAASAGVGLTAARRALRVDGPPPAAGRAPILVVELQGTMSIAAGPMAHDLTAILRELGADAVRLDIGAPGETASIGGDGRRVVVVTRDAVRHPWQREAAAALAAAHPGAVVVDVGYPDAAPANGVTRVTTYGAGRASLTAAAELIAGRTA